MAISVSMPAGFLLVTLGDMVLFGTLFGAAIFYRRTPEIHKRLILAATVALLFAAVAFRRHIIELLSHEPRSASSIAREMGVRRGEIEGDLQHALRSAAAAGHRIEIIPARCKACGFTFASDRLVKPGRCPSCKGTRLFEALIRIED